MARALRCLSIAVVALALAPGAASALSVTLQPDTGIMQISEDQPQQDTVTISIVGSELAVTAASGSVVPGGNCNSTTLEVRCPSHEVKSISADLGTEADRLIVQQISQPISAAGGPGDDRLEGGLAADVLAGGDGNDTLDGRGGVDDYFGERDNDTILARDSIAERIACGAGNDEADNDFVDILAECERGIDSDGDGVSSGADCNDGNPRIRPGAAEIFDNGVDENCNGNIDDANLDRDGDGFPRPADCDDGNAGVRPGALEVRGNDVDENCDNRAASFTRLAALVSARWSAARSHTRVRALIVRLAPRGAQIVLTCRGRSCPTRRVRQTVPRDLAPVTLHRRFRRARLRPGTRLEIAITAPETVGRTYSYTVKRGALPESRTECRAPGETRGEPC